MTLRPRLVAEVSYVGVVAVLAILGGGYRDGHYYLAAALLTLPCGLAALIAAYGGYALVQAIGGLFAPTTTAAGNQAQWLHVASGTLLTILFAAAAAANVVLLRQYRRTRAVVPAPR